MNHEPRITNKGFTLVELIIVVIIIGILAAIGLPQFAKAIETARGAEAMAGIGNIQSAEKIYFANNEVYFPSAGAGLTSSEQNALDVNLPQNGWNFQITLTGGSSNTAYNITASRKKGACANRVMVYSNEGVAVSTAWKTCADGL